VYAVSGRVTDITRCQTVAAQFRVVSERTMIAVFPLFHALKHVSMACSLSGSFMPDRNVTLATKLPRHFGNSSNWGMNICKFVRWY
jgi:hypothetical protein